MQSLFAVSPVTCLYMPEQLFGKHLLIRKGRPCGGVILSDGEGIH